MNVRKMAKVNRIICLTAVLFIAGMFSGCKSDLKQNHVGKNLESAFGQKEEDAAETLGWDLDRAEKETLSEGPLKGYSVKVSDTEFLGSEAESVHMIFMEDLSGEPRLTLLYVEYGSDESMDEIAGELENIWGEEREEMYCSWPDRIYWPEGLWAGSGTYNNVEAFHQHKKEGKRMWGSDETVESILKEEKNPEEVYGTWQQYSKAYVQSMKNDWNIVKEEPVITAVLFETCEDYKKENVLLIDGFQKFIGTYMQEQQ